MTNQSKKILVTGGAGYIGSHTLIELIAAGFTPVVYDNLSNSSPTSLARVQQIVGQSIEFIEGDILDTQLLAKTFAAHDFTAVIHFAGLKAVGESVAKPLWYYQNNVAGTLNLLDAMTNAQVKNLIFSSSATVYGDPEALPIVESSPRSATNPYGQSKLMIEYMLEDLAKSDNHWQLISLRYFNPIGAHHTGTIGENPNGIPNNLMPYVSQVAVGKLPQLSVFGNDYDTVDGTGVRDYIHVVDLANAHLCALNNRLTAQGCRAWNIGTGNGISVLQVKNTFEQVNGVQIPFEFAPRREGDVATSFADNSRALQELGWTPQYGLEDMLTDSWNWQKQNPNGYRQDE